MGCHTLLTVEELFQYIEHKSCSPIVHYTDHLPASVVRMTPGDSQALADEPHLAEQKAFYSSLIN